MIICQCRGISTKDYATEEELLERLVQDDYDCGSCLLPFANQLTMPWDFCINKHANEEAT